MSKLGPDSRLPRIWVRVMHHCVIASWARDDCTGGIRVYGYEDSDLSPSLLLKRKTHPLLTLQTLTRIRHNVESDLFSNHAVSIVRVPPARCYSRRSRFYRRAYLHGRAAPCANRLRILAAKRQNRRRGPAGLSLPLGYGALRGSPLS